MLTPESLQFNDFDIEAVNTYRAWDALEQQSGGEIIDIDLAPDLDNPLEFVNQLGVYRALTKLRERAELDDQPAIVLARLDASLMFLDVSKYGAEVEFSLYVETLMGVKPGLIDEAELNEDLVALEGLLEAQGLRYDLESRDEFEKQFGRLRTQEEIKACLSEKRGWAADAVARLAGAVAVQMEASVDSEDAAWIARFKMPKGVPKFKVNGNPRHSHTTSRIGMNAVHETGHAQHFGLLKQAIEAGQISLFLGVTTEHSLECTHEEAVSQLGEQIILPQSGRWKDIFEARYKAFRTKVIHNNAHYMINTGSSEDEVIAYVRSWIPFEPEENIRKSMKARRDNPKLRAYYYCYEPALRMVRPLVGMEPEQRAPVLHRLYRSALTPAEISQLIQAA